MKYRSEIDGLRAIAVISVLVYHAKISILNYEILKGGFLGVDIFFVISGYLITSIIFRELITTNSFSFSYFYERRVRRILPALIFVMITILPLAWIYLLPNNFIDFSKSILYSIGFSSNYYFYSSGQIYGAESGLLKPFLHTWSLSVEEQFYILFPILLLILFKYFRKYLIHTLIFLFLVSLFLAEWSSKNYQWLNFYFLPTRAWELLAGSILGFFEVTKGQRSNNKIFNLLLPTTGAILIIHSIFFFDDKILNSFYTLIPVVGTCLIIWFSNKNDFIIKILSTKLFVGIGLISYSLYLWHYPIFAFGRITQFTQGSLFNKITVVFVVIILSVISYFFVEKPARNKKKNFKIILSLILTFILTLIIFNISVVNKEGYQNRIPELINNTEIEAPWKLLKNSRGDECHQNIQGCVFGTNLKKKSLYNR